ncbi:MAG: sulfurtransferase [Blastocatellia bacterium]
MILTLVFAAAAIAQPAPAETIVSPAWVRAALDFQTTGASRPSGYQGKRLVIIEASWATAARAKDYRAAHIPGAIHLNTDELENGYPRWRLRPVAELHRVIGAHGITPETTVVVYGARAIAAARAWWALGYAGVTDVRFLNGGLAAWTAAGFRVETRMHTPRRVSFRARPRTEWLAVTDDVRERIRDGRAMLADARGAAEYLGQVTGYSYVDFKGRIPGAVPIGNADDAARLYVNENGALRELAEVRAMWERAGVTNDGREVIFYCGSGWRSSLTFLYAHALGWQNIRNYSDGWIGWSTTYTPDRRAKGSTPGWRQRRTRNPVVMGTGEKD